MIDGHGDDRDEHHDAGDDALGIATQKVASLTRVPKPAADNNIVIDERKHDTADVLCSARVGGDELICVMDFNGLSRVEAEEVLLRVKKTLSTESVAMQSSDGTLTANFGFRVGTMLVGPHDPLVFEDAVRIADLRCNDERTSSNR
jgi:GGDEF domain-containing protein